MRFLSNFGCKIIFMCSVNFWHQQDSNSLFKGSNGHVTSYCKWPIVGGFVCHVLQRMASEATDICSRLLMESNKSRFDSYSL